MPRRIRLFFGAFSLFLLFGAAMPLYRYWTQPKDIWWTPHSLLVPLAESSDRVEIYVRDEPLDALIRAGRLRIGEGPDSRVLTPGDVGLRFNNWDRVRAARTPLLLAYAAGCGITGFLFFMIVTGRIAYRGERGTADASRGGGHAQV